MKESSLPIGYLLGVLNREQSAEYVGVSPSLFDDMVADGRMPPAVVLSVGRFGWVQRELDIAIAALPRKGQIQHSRDQTRDEKAEERFDAARRAAKAAKAERHTAQP